MKKDFLIPTIFTCLFSFLYQCEDEPPVKEFISGTDETDTVEISWTHKTASPLEQGWHSGTLLDGKIYITGGVTSEGILNDLYVYDLESDIWETSKQGMFTPRWGHSTDAVNGLIYVMGGIPTGRGKALNSMEIYNPATDTWIAGETMPTGRIAHSTCVLEGKIYVMGGEAEEGPVTVFSEVDVYDPVEKSWTSAPPMLSPKDYASASAFDGKIYVIGGCNEYPWNGLTTIEMYDPETDTWEEKTSLNTGRWALSTCVIDGMIYCLGGTPIGISAGIAAVEVYDPVENKVYRATSLPSIRRAFPSIAYQDKIYAFGGCTSTDYSRNSSKTFVGVPEVN